MAQDEFLRPYLNQIAVPVHQGSHFRGHFRALSELLDVPIDMIPTDAHWQLGQVENRIQMVKRMAEKTVAELSLRGVDEMAAMAVQLGAAVNRLARSHGFSPQPRLETAGRFA